MSGKSVLIVGPGFIGWNVLDLLVAEDYKVTGYVRRKEHAAQIEACGAQVVMVRFKKAFPRSFIGF